MADTGGDESPQQETVVLVRIADGCPLVDAGRVLRAMGKAFPTATVRNSTVAGCTHDILYTRTRGGR